MYPYSRPHITEEDIAAVASVLRTPMLTQGPKVEEFERAFGQAVGASEVVSCNNGTSALHLAYAAANLGPDRALITSPLTFLSTANAAGFLGAPVFFADTDPRTGLIDPASVADVARRAPTPIGAITAVHLGGRLCDLKVLRQVADAANALLIEDACHAPGTFYDDGGERVGAGACRHSDLAVFSFHAIKHISMGEGGAVTARDPGLAKRMRTLRTHGMTRDPSEWTAPPEETGAWYYEMPEIGFNYRLPDILCAIGIGQVARLQEGIARRLEVARQYHAHLGGLNSIALPPLPTRPDENAWHLFPVSIDFRAIGKPRGQVMDELRARGVGTQVHYIPLHRQPPYRDAFRSAMDGAEAYYARTLSIPMYPQLTAEDVAVISRHLREVVGE
jgi:dTDP-4-amino-4,6-dideoxygalactose transaminase